MSKTPAEIICIIGLMCMAGCATQSNTLIPVFGEQPLPDKDDIQRHQFMVGTWTEESLMADGTYRMELVDRNISGRYRIQFRKYNKDGTYKDDIEVGEWGISGNIYFTITKGVMVNDDVMPTDLTEPDNYDAYTIIKLTSDEFVYKYVELPDVYSAKRVDVNYQLPDTAPSMK